jgi:uncharacterized protein YcbK (DUF882 family)
MAYDYFTDQELACGCGCDGKMDPTYMEKLISMRIEADFPFNLSSAYRCPTYNAKVSHTGLTGPHTTGRAVDVLISRKHAYRFMELAFKHGMTGIGVSQKGKDRFLHIDDLTSNVRPWIWSY